ncbi:peroxidase 57-like [Ananas comosus]|uniref:Peroxidase n=1 Tax=Ananas comosus TaxID=4615 RepID=A0A6P5F908_ANACO|nr:peroxidase 57-like [Ananas comosus]
MWKLLSMATLYLLITLLLAHSATTALSLQVHFYSESCPRVEIIVQQVVQRHFQQDPSVPAGLLRLHFHDCFVRGCDGSVLIDSTDDNIAEKEAPPNLTLRTYDVIDEINTELEKECSGVVSCADMLALAARDGVALAGGPAYALPTGRRDGTVSTLADAHLPSPSFSVDQALAAFQSVNLDLVDLTTLLGAHSMGLCHCGFFIDRLYDYKGSGSPDPTMEPNVLNTLQQKCPPHLVTIDNITEDSIVFMNQVSSTPFHFDNSLYHASLNEKAVLQIDQELAFTDVTSKLAAQYANNPGTFLNQFAKSMIKLGSIGVLTGQEGEIRLNCRVVNNATSNSSTANFGPEN